jgi:rubrerythrin
MRTALTAVILTAATLAGPMIVQAASLEKPAQAALLRALDDEYHAEAFYDAVMAKFGQVRPFTNIIKSERTHASMLADVMKSHGMAVPANTLLGSADLKAAVPATLGEACKAGVDAEIANRDLYQKQLMPAAAGHKDIEAVFERLSAASNDKHLPAFQRCATRW